jgi:hypothetical protein
LHGWLLLDAESVRPRADHKIECEGHFLEVDTRDIALIETTEYLPDTRGLTDAEFEALKTKSGQPDNAARKPKAPEGKAS